MSTQDATGGDDDGITVEPDDAVLVLSPKNSQAYVYHLPDEDNPHTPMCNRSQVSSGRFRTKTVAEIQQLYHPQYSLCRFCAGTHKPAGYTGTRLSDILEREDVGPENFGLDPVDTERQRLTMNDE